MKSLPPKQLLLKVCNGYVGAASKTNLHMHSISCVHVTILTSSCVPDWCCLRQVKVISMQYSLHDVAVKKPVSCIHIAAPGRCKLLLMPPGMQQLVNTEHVYNEDPQWVYLVIKMPRTKQDLPCSCRSLHSSTLIKHVVMYGTHVSDTTIPQSNAMISWRVLASWGVPKNILPRVYTWAG